MELKHTPTPWKLDPNLLGQIESRDETKLIARAGRVEPIADLDQRERAANAEFIVRACNSHHQLVAALKDAKVLLELNGVDLKDEADYGNGEHAYQTVSRIHEALAAAGAA